MSKFTDLQADFNLLAKDVRKIESNLFTIRIGKSHQRDLDFEVSTMKYEIAEMNQRFNKLCDLLELEYKPAHSKRVEATFVPKEEV